MHASHANRWASLELPIGGDFDLEAAVCSHGLFMMAPNNWDPLSKTLQRPLRCTSRSVVARISQPPHGPPRLLVRVRANTLELTRRDEEALLAQVARMLRLSESEERICREFREVYYRSFAVARVFRSPSLFEDMVKCILLCNCSWPRTLSMAQALCDLQLELQTSTENSDFIPKTPAGKEPGHTVERLKVRKCLTAPSDSDSAQAKSGSNEILCNADSDSAQKDGSIEKSCRADSDSGQTKNAMREKLSSSDSDSDLDEKSLMGNFPTPFEISKLDENFLAKRCKLGYRAKRIMNLARGIEEGRIELQQMEEETSKAASLRSYSKLDEQLRQINGFGPFTRANVLMCMGFYHVIPSDSETVRHLKQFHAKISSVRTVEKDVQEIYAKFAPFQFLAYWSELWHFYETRFGKMSEMPASAYKLITASNMRSEAHHGNKRKKRASRQKCLE